MNAPVNLFHQPLFPEIIPGRYIRRLNRFVIECDLGGQVVQAHLPNPGRLWELLIPGRVVKLVKNTLHPERATPFTAVAVEREGVTVLLHTQKSNDVVHFLLEERQIPGLETAAIVKREFTLAGSRFDFLLKEGNEKILLEVKSCTLFGTSLAMFPDAVTARGRRHLLELAAHSRDGYRCGVIFVIHSPGPAFFLPDYHTDYAFSQTFQEQKDLLFYRALRVSWQDDLRLGRGIRDESIPWPLLARECRDQGSYLLLITLPAGVTISVGSLGRINFPAGYYLYAGSAKRNLAKRLDRHLRKRKNFHWHIDYLRDVASSCIALPFRTQDDLEHVLAAALVKIADWSIPKFGASDCSCPSHLFGMEVNPLHRPDFLGLLQYFRMDRLTAPDHG
ncbi:MAG TPA: DNA/RNA nuclease SfsA [Syntrophus sp. (in: bacteria)]|nr:DNA/RNA nuclease SfsA [Syntrophus sp. (in: bacteria)]